MRTSAEINQLTISVRGNFTTVRDFLLDQLSLERVYGEKSKGIVLAQDESVESLFFSDELGRRFLNIFVVFLGKDIFGTGVAVVEESCVGWRSMTEMTSELILKSCSQDMCAGVPESFLTKEVIKLEELKIAVAFERSSHVPSKPLVIGRNS